MQNTLFNDHTYLNAAAAAVVVVVVLAVVKCRILI